MKDKYLPGYIMCKTVIKRLQYFQDLIRHDQKWPTQIKLAKPLDKLIRGIKPPNTSELLHREINRLIPIVMADLARANIGMLIIYEHTERKYDFEKNIPKHVEKKEQFHVIYNYYDLPHKYKDFEMVIDILERGIGWYEERARRAFMELLNPLYWIAYILRMPLLVLKVAGLETGNKIVSDAYAFLIQTIMLLLLLSVTAKLGISIPWDTLVRLIGR